MAHHHLPHGSPGAGGLAQASVRSAIFRITRPTCLRTAARAAVRASDLRRAAEILNAGKKIAILAGQGAVCAPASNWSKSPKSWRAPIIKALLGKAAVPDDSPYTTGGIGLLGTKPSQDALEECDTLLIVGSSFPYIEFMPRPGKARGVQIDLDPKRIGLRYPVEFGLVGDCRAALEELLPLLERKENREFPGKGAGRNGRVAGDHAQAGDPPRTSR